MKGMNLLGKKVSDKVTGFVGIVTSVSYDLYGCIQAIVTPLEKDDGKDSESKSRWLDISRLDVVDNTPVMEIPDFESGPIAKGKKGPAFKPQR